MLTCTHKGRYVPRKRGCSGVIGFSPAKTSSSPHSPWAALSKGCALTSVCMSRRVFERQLYDDGQALALSSPQLPHLEAGTTTTCPHLLDRVVVRISNHQRTVPRTVPGFFRALTDWNSYFYKKKAGYGQCGVGALWALPGGCPWVPAPHPLEPPSQLPGAWVPSESWAQPVDGVIVIPAPSVLSMLVAGELGSVAPVL